MFKKHLSIAESAWISSIASAKSGNDPWPKAAQNTAKGSYNRAAKAIADPNKSFDIKILMNGDTEYVVTDRESGEQVLTSNLNLLAMALAIRHSGKNPPEPLKITIYTGSMRSNPLRLLSRLEYVSDFGLRLNQDDVELEPTDNELRARCRLASELFNRSDTRMLDLMWAATSTFGFTIVDVRILPIDIHSGGILIKNIRAETFALPELLTDSIATCNIAHPDSGPKEFTKVLTDDEVEALSKYERVAYEFFLLEKLPYQTPEKVVTVDEYYEALLNLIAAHEMILPLGFG